MNNLNSFKIIKIQNVMNRQHAIKRFDTPNSFSKKEKNARQSTLVFNASINDIEKDKTGK